MNKVVAALIAILFITACKKDNASISETGINLSITANNTYDFDDIKVSFRSLEYQTLDSGSVWKSLPLIDTNPTGYINIHTILHGNGSDLSNAGIVPVHMTNIRIKIAPTAYVSKQGVVYPLIIPDEIQKNGIIVSADYNITSGKIKSIVLVYNTYNSIETDSSANTFTFKPDFRTFDPSVCGNIEGYLKPDNSRPYVTVYSDNSSTNTSAKFSEVTIPYTGGYFKMTGIPVGKYNVKLGALNAAYPSRELSNIGVVKGQTNPVGTYTLDN